MAGSARGSASSAPRARTLAAALFAATLALSVTAAAQAQDDPLAGVEDPVGATATAEEPGPACEEKTSGLPGCDTEYTPIAKEGADELGWSMVSGQVFRPPGRDDPVDSGDYDEANTQTPATVDFFAIDFANTANGLAGGARCQNDPDPNLTGPALDNYLADCTRVPVIYRYGLDSQGLARWTEVFRGTSPGYIGAVTWLRNEGDTSTALAVGGTGCYPRREDPNLCPAAQRPPADPTGRTDEMGGTGIAFYSSDVRGSGEFEPVSFGQNLPSGPSVFGVTGMSTADSTYGLSEKRLSDCRAATECAFVGGYRQLWMWRDGGFAQHFTPDTPDRVVSEEFRTKPDAETPTNTFGRKEEPVPAPDIWRYRVRAVQFASDTDGFGRAVGNVRVYAATSGCCSHEAAAATQHIPATFDFTSANQQWGIQYHDMGTNPAVIGIAGYRVIPSDTNANAEGRVLPDSIYAIHGVTKGNAGPGAGALFSPGGPERPGEPGSYLATSQPLGTPETPANEGNGGFLDGPTLGAARLVAAEGNFQRRQPTATNGVLGNACTDSDCAPNTLLDWAVGELKSSGPPHARQAIAYTSTTRSADEPASFPFDCPSGGLSGAIQRTQPTDCEPDSELTGEMKSGTLFRLPSYSLNAYRVIGATDSAWAVGDRGAILRRGGDGTASGLPPEERPSLGARKRGAAPDTAPFEDAEQPLTAEPGMVPSLALRPPTETSEPQLTAYGSPDPENNAEEAALIAMSRDGSEGWAAGPPLNPESSGRVDLTLYRFDGAKWTKCRFHRIPGVIEADPACAALRSLYDYNVGGARPRITALTRIPLEYDSNPSNDDEFEAIAIATRANGVTGVNNNTVLRYRNGKWGIDIEATRSLAVASRVGTPLDPNFPSDFSTNPADHGTPYGIAEIAFTAPDDGWMYGDGIGAPQLFHWDGDRWTSCFDLNAAQYGQRNIASCQDRGLDRSPANGHQGIFPFPGWINALRLTTVGERVYFYGTRATPPAQTNIKGSGSGTPYPFILYNDPGPCEKEGDPGCWKAAFDPYNDIGADSTDPATKGTLDSLSVAQASDGTYTGFGMGSFGNTTGIPVNAGSTKFSDREAETAILRSEPNGITWRPVPVEGPARDYMLSPTLAEAAPVGQPLRFEVTALAAAQGQGSAVAAWKPGGRSSNMLPMLRFEPTSARWEVFHAPWITTADGSSDAQNGARTIAPDGAGGLWLTEIGPVNVSQPHGTSFYRYTPNPPEPVFTDSPHPIREPISATASGGDGSLWVATESSAVYRYDRITGWDRTTIPGWDPGRVVTNPSEATALAIGPDGEGVIVGEGGRIADISPGGAVLDRAAGVLCTATGNQEPCGSGRDLKAAAVAPDGSAIVAGDYLSLLWRSPNGEFRAIDPPGMPAASFASITALSMPSPDRAWLTTDTGYVFAGTLQGSDWSWSPEALEDSETIARDDDGAVQPLSAIALDSSGRGFAVGEGGVILERSGEGEWRFIGGEYRYDFTSLALDPTGEGAIVGGKLGVILTFEGGRFEPARHFDWFDPLTLGWRPGPKGTQITGVAIVPGNAPGEIEAWAAPQIQPDSQVNSARGGILHYSSDAADPLLDGAVDHTSALRDSPEAAPGELSFVTFGNSGCQHGSSRETPCPELTGSNLANDVIARRVRDEVLAEAPDFALFSGDVANAAGDSRTDFVGTGLDESTIHRRWSEQIARPLVEAGVPTFAAIGGKDHAYVEHCSPVLPSTGCHGARQTEAGHNLAWRRTMATMPAPWGFGEEASSGSGLAFAGVDSSQVAVELGDHKVEDETGVVPAVKSPEIEVPKEVPDPFPGQVPRQVPAQTAGGEGYMGETTIPTGGAHTHYVFDVQRDDQKLIRVIVVDTSMKSLAASDPLQNPTQEQLTWLQEVLASAPQGARKVVVSNTPTYSYGPGAGTDTQTDATAFESVLMANDVDLVVSGRLGWNALYYALAPGLHYPCPGAAYPGGENASATCGVAGTAEAEKLAGELQKSAASVVSEGEGAGQALPFVVAASAGGEFGPHGEFDGDASHGVWHGYTIVRMGTGNDQRIVVEQRPILEWIGISGSTHTLSARQRVGLKGFGREPAGMGTALRYLEIDSPAITHRYDLLLGKPDTPWLPCREGEIECDELHANLSDGEAGVEENPCSPYLCLPKRVGTIDRLTGEVRAGDGRYPDVFGIAMLSVNQKVATYPIAFVKSPSFVVKTQLRVPGAPPTNNVPTPKPPGQPPLPDTPTIPKIEVPAIPAPPAIPSLTAAAPPELTPPAPPAPPPPAEQPTPLDLTVAPPGVSISTPTALIQPPTPPVNPAPPGGARKEARQRQAAAQKGGADSDASDQVDLADGPKQPEGAAMTRHDHSFSRVHRSRPEPSFTAYRPAGDGSPLGPGVLYASGLTLLAFALAAGWRHGRPTPRRQTPLVPAPARSSARYYRS